MQITLFGLQLGAHELKIISLLWYEKEICSSAPSNMKRNLSFSCISIFFSFSNQNVSKQSFPEII